jgi:TPR repeat protein
VKYYILSADRGNASAQVDYGRCLEYGIGIAKNAWEAVKYYKLSADGGNSVAQKNFARLANASH